MKYVLIYDTIILDKYDLSSIISKSTPSQITSVFFVLKTPNPNPQNLPPPLPLGLMNLIS